MVKSWMGFGLVACVAALGGCSGSSQGNGPLGVAEFKIDETAAELRIVGLADDGRQVAEVTVEATWVSVPEEEIEGLGRVITATVADKRMIQRSVGFAMLALPINEQTDPQLRALVSDPLVVARLAARGVGFTVVERPVELPAGEASYSYSTCTFSTSSCGTSVPCGEYTSGGNVYEDVCCTSSDSSINRECSGAPSCSSGTYGMNGCPSGSTPVCPSGTVADGQFCSNGCGDIGPRGCAICNNATNTYFYGSGGVCNVSSGYLWVQGGLGAQCPGAPGSGWCASGYYCSTFSTCCPNGTSNNLCPQ